MSDPQNRFGFSPGYRVFTISKSGRIDKPPVPIEAENDQEAMRQAGQLFDSHDIELWDRERLVVRLAAKNR